MYLLKNFHGLQAQIWGFLALFFLLSLTACQKNELVPSEPARQAELSNLALEKVLLEFNFHISTLGLTDIEVEELYDKNIATLAEEDRSQLIELGLQALEHLERTPGSFSRLTVRSSSDESVLTSGVPGDGYGRGVATSGNKVYVGAWTEGKVYEYAKQGGAYVLVDEITPTGASSGFGYRISVNGSWMAVGAPAFVDRSIPAQVFLFKKEGGSWVQKTALTGPAGNSSFGTNVVLQNNMLAVTSSLPGFPIQSVISVFENTGYNWSLLDELYEPGYSFTEIDMDSGGNHIVGAASLNSSFATIRAGIFTREGSGWSFEDLIIDDPDAAFPRDIAIHNTTIALAANFPGTTHYVIQYSGGSWQWVDELEIPNTSTANHWIDIQGQKIAIGVTNFAGNPEDQSIYVFGKSGTSWQLNQELTPSDIGGSATMIDMALSGNTIVAGFQGSPGRAYVFD